MATKIDATTVQELYGKADAQYEVLAKERQTLEDTWRACSALTLPYIFPDESLREGNMLPTPYNSVGPASVNILASKLIISLLPFTQTFFRLLPYEEDIKGLDKTEKAAVDKRLSSIEKDIITLIDLQGLRVPLTEAMKYLIITGNTMVYKTPKGKIKVFSPYQFAVERDYVGNILKIVIKERISITALPQEVRNLIKAHEKKEGESKEENSEDIYTIVCKIDEKNFISYQEVDGQVIPNTFKKYSNDLMPYIPLRWTALNNENYGRGLVEQYLGDLRSLEGLSQMILEGTSIMAKTIFGLRKASTTALDDLKNADNGDFIYGDLEKDISVLRVDKASDFSIPFQLMQNLEQRISKAFLVFSGNIRDSERTTATEVRATSAELEATLGGTYSVLASELQLPLIRILLDEVDPTFLKMTQPSIITGASAISREKDYANLNTMLQSMAQLGPEAVGTYLNVSGYLTALATALGMNPDDMVNSQETIDAKQQAMAQAQAPAQAMPELPQA